MGKKPKRAGVWGKNLNRIFSIVNFVHKYRIYRLFRNVSATWLNLFSRSFGFFFNRKTVLLHQRINQVYNLLP